jgi:predicted outer membrane repeat protein
MLTYSPCKPVSFHILLLSSAIAAADIAFATTLEINPGGDSIQSTIDSAADGDTLLIYPGTYYESELHFDAKDLVLRSVAPDDSATVAATVIDASNDLYRGVFRLDSGQSRATEILGLTLRGGTGTIIQTGGWGHSSTAGGAIYVADHASPRIAHCVFRDNYVVGTSGKGAALCLDHSEALVESCSFEQNTGPGDTFTAVLAISQGTPEIWDCRFTNCGTGAFQTSSSSVAAGGCYVRGASFGVQVEGGAHGCRSSFTDWTIEHCSPGIKVRYGGRADFSDVVVRECSSGLDAGGVVVSSSTATFTDCRFEGNTSSGYWGAGGGAMTLVSASTIIDGCDFIGNYSHWTGAGLYSEGGSVQLLRTLFRDNWAEAEGGAVALFESGTPTIDRCTLVNNSALDGGGIYIAQGAALDLTSSIVYSNAPEAIVDIEGDASIDYSDIEGGWSGTDNIDADPLFCNPSCADRDYTLAATSPCADGGQGGVSMGAEPVVCPEPVNHTPRTIQVPGDAPTLEEALAIACEGDAIELSAQLHAVSAPIENHGLALSFRSSDPSSPDVVAATILSADGDHALFKFTPVVGESPLLDGLTIRDGSVGIACDGGSTIIRHCQIHDNGSSTASGGGVRCEHGSTVEIEDCAIYDNVAMYGGGVHADLSIATLRRCDLHGNHADKSGGGVYAIGGSAVEIIASTIEENSAQTSGGGVCCRGGAAPTLHNCCIAYNNSGSSGGGIEAFESQMPELEFCSFISNSAGNYGGGIYANGLPGYPEFDNMILWGNTPDQWNGLPHTFNYSDVQGGASGTGNIDFDPQLGLYLQLYRLPAPGSPCIDTGDPGISDAIYDAHPRWPRAWTNGERADMGAFGGPANRDWVPR